MIAIICHFFHHTRFHISSALYIIIISCSSCPTSYKLSQQGGKSLEKVFLTMIVCWVSWPAIFPPLSQVFIEQFADAAPLGNLQFVRYICPHSLQAQQLLKMGMIRPLSNTVSNRHMLSQWSLLPRQITLLQVNSRNQCQVHSSIQHLSF